MTSQKLLNNENSLSLFFLCSKVRFMLLSTDFCYSRQHFGRQLFSWLRLLINNSSTNSRIVSHRNLLQLIILPFLFATSLVSFCNILLSRNHNTAFLCQLQDQLLKLILILLLLRSDCRFCCLLTFRCSFFSLNLYNFFKIIWASVENTVSVLSYSQLQLLFCT